jgi:hypothetical protein
MTKDKEFDSVKLMRSIRDELSKKYQKMSIKEEIMDLHKNFPNIKWHVRERRMGNLSRPKI